ncbi:hypothetical protein [Piscirickettsia salmonis]|uniref:hypothetical protein n=1 Tax=Piscirickettsia salmonis TaxID=1238 RepID=UPI0012BA20DC|nr:hypothetical protein [Piscirickettsia salmonis]
MLGDFASLDVQNTYRGSDAYVDVCNFFRTESGFYRQQKQNEVSLRCDCVFEVSYNNPFLSFR